MIPHTLKGCRELLSSRGLIPAYTIRAHIEDGAARIEYHLFVYDARCTCVFECVATSDAEALRRAVDALVGEGGQ